jgi:DNA-binding protein YbaB
VEAGVGAEWQERIAQDPWVKATREFEPHARQALGVGPEARPEDLLGEFERQQRLAVEATQLLDDTEFTTTSENGLISVTMTGKAQILALVIDDEAVVRYRPDELGPAVLETLNKATAHCGELVRESLAGLFGRDDSTLDAIMESWPAHRVDADDDGRPQADWA